ncbi:MAG: hypothetical protein WKF97_12415 [Chitinophagaceae bacterium]
MKLLCCLGFFFFVLISSSYANNYNTPGTGVKWNLDDLVINSAGDVTFSAGIFHINDTIFIRQNDTLYITADAIVDFAVNTYLDVNGTLIVDPPTAVTFTAQNVSGGFYGIRVDSSNSTVLRKLTLEYAVSLRLNDCNIIVDSCIFRYNSPTTNFGNAAISLFRASPVITNCQFLDNQRAAIQGGANINNAPKIIGCLFRGNNTLNLNVPQINLGATGDGTDTVQIINNQILRASVNSGGIGFLPIGNVYAVIKGNVIKNNRYGMTFNGGSNINTLISYNQVDSNNIQGDPFLGGSGISFAGGTATSQQNSIVTGNLFRWNLWGITILNRSRPNLGNITNADTADDGKNQFINNTNAATPGIDLYNNSVDPIFAQNNYWGSNDINDIENKIFHQVDNPVLGPVNYSNFILPVELTQFTALAKEKNVILNWQTVSENNSHVFIIEKSSDGRLFIPIATISASGYTSSFKTYSYTDKLVFHFNHTFFYRLKMVDQDNRFNYSSVVTMNLDHDVQTQAVKIYPTYITASQVIQVNIISSKNQTVTIGFFDATGRKLSQTTKLLTAGNNQFTCKPDAHLPNGLIYVGFTGEDINRTIKVLKH